MWGYQTGSAQNETSEDSAAERERERKGARERERQKPKPDTEDEDKWVEMLLLKFHEVEAAVNNSDIQPAKEGALNATSQRR